MFGDGDGWVRCTQGHRHWGVYGAAGLLLRHVDTAGRRWILLQHRAAWSHHGGTWGLPGGARKRGESAEATALREAVEEVAVDLASLQVASRYDDDHGGWSYVTILAVAPMLLPAEPRSHETSAVRWLPEDDVTALDLHPGLAGSWSALRTL